MSDFTAVG